MKRQKENNIIDSFTKAHLNEEEVRALKKILDGAYYKTTLSQNDNIDPFERLRVAIIKQSWIDMISPYSLGTIKYKRESAYYLLTIGYQVMTETGKSVLKLLLLTAYPATRKIGRTDERLDIIEQLQMEYLYIDKRVRKDLGVNL